MDIIGELIARALKTPDDDRALAMIQTEVETLCRKFPLYPEALSESRPAPSSRRMARWRARFPASRRRPGQIEMAVAVARRFEEGGVLLAEAGTGTGKTLAYLIPAILSRQRVLISTGTKNLQEQIYFKDIPALRDALGVPFTATYMKGRANYLCLHRLDQLDPGDRSAGARRHASVAFFLPFSGRCGERLPADHPRVVRAARRPAIARSSPTCPKTCRSGTTSRRPPKPVSAPNARATTTVS